MKEDKPSKQYPKITIICAMGKNYVIGKENKLPWELPTDLRHFKELTVGKPVIMGRKTFTSIGKPLSNRRNIVITHDQDLNLPGCEVVHSLTEALSLTKENEEVMIIGGANIFAQALPLAHQIYLTIIDQDFFGDAYFPKWNVDEWQETDRVNYDADEKNPYAYSFLTLTRVKGRI